MKKAAGTRIMLTLLVLILATGLVAGDFLAMTLAYCTDIETAAGNNFQAWSASLWAQTTQADFEAGVLSQVSTTSSPNDVELATSGDWYGSDWLYRREITIDHAKVDDVADPSTTYADFPVLVYATGLSNIKANGADIRFTGSDGVSELPREIESYSGGTLYAWVKTTLTKDAGDSSDDVIYMYYGNAAASEPAPDSTYGSENVWDSNFVMVHHLEETDIDGGSGDIKDSTANNNDGTTSGMDVADQVAGQIGGSLDFDGTDDYVQVADNASLTPPNDYTFEIWFSQDVMEQVNLIYKEHSVDPWGSYTFEVAGDDWQCWSNWVSDNGSWENTGYFNGYTTGVWYHFVAVREGGSVFCYFNASTNNTWTDNATGTMYDSDSALWIGGNPWGDRFDGKIDEIRISNTARSANWVQTTYNNQSNPSAFCNVSAEEALYTTIADDDFESGGWSGGSGWLWDWWHEVDAAVTSNGTPHGGSYHLRLMSTDDYVDRALNLSGRSNVRLQFWAKADGFEAASYAECAVDDGTGADTVASWSDGDDDNTYHFYDIDLSGYDMSSEFYVTFYGDLSGANDYLYIDDLAIVASSIAVDDFESGDWGGGSGWLWDWWHEVDAAVTTSGTPHGGSYHLRFMSTDDYVDRALDLTGMSNVRLQFWAKADGFEAASYAECAVDDGTGADTVASWSDGDDDNTYHFYDIDLSGYDMSSEFYVTFYGDLSGANDYLYIDDIAFVSEVSSSGYYTSGTLASQVLDTGASGTIWNMLFWDETLQSNTDITFEVRASDTLFAKDAATPSWNAVGGTSPVMSGLPTGRYLQWRVTLTTLDTDNTPTLHEVRVYYY